MKKCMICLAVLAFLAMPACGTTAEDTPPTQPTPTSTQDKPTYLRAEELTVNGISWDTTKEQLVERLGRPKQIVRPEEEAHVAIYDYGSIQFDFESSDTVTSIGVSGKAEQTPRDIQVGDTFGDVLRKFPREKDYKTSEDHAFYGQASMIGEYYGYVNAEGDVGKPTVVVVTSAGGPFLKVHFKEGRVAQFALFASRIG